MKFNRKFIVIKEVFNGKKCCLILVKKYYRIFVFLFIFVIFQFGSSYRDSVLSFKWYFFDVREGYIYFDFKILWLYILICLEVFFRQEQFFRLLIKSVKDLFVVIWVDSRWGRQQVDIKFEKKVVQGEDF